MIGIAKYIVNPAPNTTAGVVGHSTNHKSKVWLASDTDNITLVISSHIVYVIQDML